MSVKIIYIDVTHVTWGYNIFRHQHDQYILRKTCIKNTQSLLKNQHAATARLFLRKVSGIVVVYELGINLTC